MATRVFPFRDDDERRVSMRVPVFCLVLIRTERRDVALAASTTSMAGGSTNGRDVHLALGGRQQQQQQQVTASGGAGHRSRPPKRRGGVFCSSRAPARHNKRSARVFLLDSAGLESLARRPAFVVGECVVQVVLPSRRHLLCPCVSVRARGSARHRRSSPHSLA